MIATLSLDLDNEWSYIKTHGDPGWESFPSYLDLAVPRFLSLFEQLGVKATVFVVGQDADLAKNNKALRSLAVAGHEIGNHSYSHEPWLHLYSAPDVEEEIAKAERAIEAATGVHPTGFRGPGYSISESVLSILAKRGYIFDASTLPTFIGPLSRAYYFFASRLDEEQQAQRKILFGSLKDGLRPILPYRWDVGETGILEIPVTTMPILRIPFHVSYLLYLSRFSPAASRVYFHTALLLCKFTNTEPSILLHPLDLLGRTDVSTLRFFPGMDLDASFKSQRVLEYLQMLKNHFEIRTLGEYARVLQQRSSLGIRPFKN
jgi:peptidoglycan-N-acetylglucosamine deacetylase